MTIAEVSEQQLATHAELGWDPGEVMMAHQRTNWLRSLGLIERIDTQYHLTAAGRAFVREAVERHTTTAVDDATMTASASDSVGSPSIVLSASTSTSNVSSMSSPGARYRRLE